MRCFGPADAEKGNFYSRYCLTWLVRFLWPGFNERILELLLVSNEPSVVFDFWLPKELGTSVKRRR